MWEMVRRVEGINANEVRDQDPKGEAVGFTAKLISIGVLAGLGLTYCNALIDACFRGLH
jgi:hypothetical protein